MLLLYVSDEHFMPMLLPAPVLPELGHSCDYGIIRSVTCFHIEGNLCLLCLTKSILLNLLYVWICTCIMFVQYRDPTHTQCPVLSVRK